MSDIKIPATSPKSPPQQKQTNPYNVTIHNTTKTSYEQTYVQEEKSAT